MTPNQQRRLLLKLNEIFEAQQRGEQEEEDNRRAVGQPSGTSSHACSTVQQEGAPSRAVAASYELLSVVSNERLYYISQSHAAVSGTAT